ncbi:nucleotide sugar dehydrogenase [bacterium]|nr:nucleotide sugar dehydrogenase [bacterium]
MSAYEDLKRKIESYEAEIGILGLGYVGLPLAIEFCKAGYKVSGYDISKRKVDLVNSGSSDVDDVSSRDVAQYVSTGALRAYSTPEILSTVDILPICVPTPLSKTKDPDMSYIRRAANDVKRFLRPGHLIILESTTYPGTTQNELLPLFEETGLRVGKDFFLAFSPERVDPGNPHYNTKNTPKVVGGVTKACLELTLAIYSKVIDTLVPVSSPMVAEMTKLYENTFRNINIGLTNEFAIICDKLKIDVWEVIDAAATKPFGFMKFTPGPGLGGHCIPIDPHYLSWKMRGLNYHTRFIDIAGDVNSNMPNYVVLKCMEVLNRFKKSLNGSKVLVLGISYKENISDIRESPALEIMKLLKEQGAKVIYNDPYVPSYIDEETGEEICSTPLTVRLLQESDLTLILVAHSDYDYDFIVKNSQIIFDTRNATKGIVSDKLFRLGATR